MTREQVETLVLNHIVGWGKHSDFYIRMSMWVRHMILATDVDAALESLSADGRLVKRCEHGVPFYSLPVHDFIPVD